MLIYSKIQAQQNTNNAKRTMKSECGSIRFCLHFSFRCRLLCIMCLLRIS